MPNMNKVGYHLNEDHPAAFAATHEGYEALRWRVPVDDTNTMHFTLYFAPMVDGKVSAKVPKDQRSKDWATARRAISLGRRDRLDRARRSGPLRPGKPGTGF